MYQETTLELLISNQALEIRCNLLCSTIQTVHLTPEEDPAVPRERGTAAGPRQLLASRNRSQKGLCQLSYQQLRAESYQVQTHEAHCKHFEAKWQIPLAYKNSLKYTPC